MIKSYKIKWDDYLELMNSNDINEINSRISSCDKNSVIEAKGDKE